MQLFNRKVINFESKNKIAYLGALTLLFSYAEFFIPKIVPFFRLGLANVPVMAGLTLSPLSFITLLFIKAFCSSMMAGTLYTPFFLISLLQSIGSGMAMYVVFNLNEQIQTGAQRKKIFSIYGISIFGSAVSALIQIACCYIYLGAGTITLLGPMLIFSLFSGFITALLLIILEIPDTAPVLLMKENQKKDYDEKNFLRSFLTLLKVAGLFIAAIIIFTLDSWKILLPVMVACLILQIICGRKILFLPYIIMWIFIIISCLLVPQGKVIYSFWKIKITYGALMEGITKAMILTSVSALSQCMAGIRFTGDDSFLALVFKFYQRLQNAYKNANGNVFEKLKAALSSKEL